jgi:hypothetical protein
MWLEGYTSVCRDSQDLLAVYESPRGTLALLLRQPLVAPPGERRAWRRGTRMATGRVVARLRGAGFRGPVLALQGQPATEVARIVDRWTCRYACEHARLPVGASPRPPEVLPGRGASPGWLDDADPLLVPRVTRWYRGMTSSWMAVEPATRRQLILAAHRWIVEAVLAPLADGRPPAMDEVRPGGRLMLMLEQAVPTGEEAAIWSRWIALVVGDLERALNWPAAIRREAWLRWLFLIPYSMPIVRRAWGSRAMQADPWPETPVRTLA